MSTMSVQMVAGENLQLSTNFFKASLKCLRHNAIDHITVGCHHRMGDESREYLNQCDWVDTIIDLKGNNFSDWRNEVLDASPKTDYIFKVDADETYFYDTINNIKEIIDEDVRELVFVSIDHLMISPDKKQDVGHIPVVIKSGPRWTKGVHEFLRMPNESNNCVAEGTFVHWGYAKSQLSTFLKWAFYELIEYGHLGNYKKENIEQKDGSIKQLKWFRDWRKPHTILDDRRSVLKSHKSFPDPVYEDIFVDDYVFNMIEKTQTSSDVDIVEEAWMKHQRAIDPSLFEWYDNIREQTNENWIKFLEELENGNWPEVW